MHSQKVTKNNNTHPIKLLYGWSETATLITSSTSSNSTRLFLILKKYFSAFICRAKSCIISHWTVVNYKKTINLAIRRWWHKKLKSIKTCLTMVLPSIGMSSSLVIFDMSLTAHSVSKLNFWNISSCKL